MQRTLRGTVRVPSTSNRAIVLSALRLVAILQYIDVFIPERLRFTPLFRILGAIAANIYSFHATSDLMMPLLMSSCPQLSAPSTTLNQALNQALKQVRVIGISQLDASQLGRIGPDCDASTPGLAPALDIKTANN